ncbi:MAG: hypothetical protein M3Z17_02670 [Gemmatimonadota bacterium]|nr:hypothetical protein [Gemmatimonadota bacterium]
MPRRRGGFALIAALLCVVVLGALIVGAFLATNEDVRVTGSESLSLHALSVAESAVQTSFTGWAGSQADSLVIGQSVGHTLTMDGIVVQATLVRLDSSVFWLVADAGTAGREGGADQPIRRRIGLYLRRVSDSAGRGSFMRFEERAWSELF